MGNSRKWLMAMSATAAIIFAACGSESSESSGGTETIRLARNNWTASMVETEILSQLITANLGNPVEIVDIDENAMFAGLSSGELDAVPEVWQSGVTPDEQAFVDDGSVTNVGLLGAIGKTGWFIPQYALDKYPQLATWEGLTDPEVVAAFATAATGDKGRFLGMDPSFAQFDESIIANLQLPYQVQYSGSEAATMAEIEARAANKEPVLMYYWMPAAAIGKYNLVNIALPQPTVVCSSEPEKCDGDYPEDVLYKLASTKLKDKDAKVWAFLEKFALSNADLLGLLPKIEIDKQDVVAVAAEWIANNEAVWKAWLG